MAGKNLHLTHLEELPLIRGGEGLRIAIGFCEQLKQQLVSDSPGDLSVTVKWDGSPAIVCGMNPETNKFFVGTKSVFAKTEPKVNYTPADIRNNHPDEGLQKILIQALKHLAKLGIPGVWQGDLLFTPDMIKTQKIDGESYITFQPNTIVYAIPHPSPLSAQILKAKLGIVFHTVYNGETLESMTASFTIPDNALTPTKDVWVQDAQLKNEGERVMFSAKEAGEFTDQLLKVKQQARSLSVRFLNEFITRTDLMQLLLKTINNEVRGNQSFTSKTASQVYRKFVLMTDELLSKQILAAKRPDTKQNRIKTKTMTLNYLREHQADLEKILIISGGLAELKTLAIRKFEKIQSVKGFLETSKGFKATSPEGFVAFSQKHGAVVKLVDRLEFSRANIAQHGE